MHIAFIMDGNRRWATARNLMKSLGHNEGVRALERMLEACTKRNIEFVSFWALAKKNIEERSKAELGHIYDLLEKEIKSLTPKMVKNGVRFDIVGDPDLLPEGVRKALSDAKKTTEHGKKTTCVLAIGYGGQDEIVRAVKRCIAEGVDPETLDEKSFSNYLDSGRFPAPDLIVRTGGDTRHSGYFLYQSEYSEYAFSKTLWPDFSVAELEEILSDFQKAKRNF